jgi:predicted DNA-binding transcriptional regulator AlpA
MIKGEGMETKRLVTVEELAQLFKIKVSWVYQNIQEIPHIKFGHLLRFDPEEVLSELKKRTRNRV